MCKYNYLLLMILSLFLISFLSCNKSDTNATDISYDRLGEYIVGYSSNNMDISEEIKLMLTKVVDTANVKAVDVIRISPDIAGEAYWYNNTEIRFRPSEPLKASTDYQIIILLSKIYDTVPSELKKITVNIGTKILTIKNSIDEIDSEGEKKNKMVVKGTITSNMKTTSSFVENNFNVSQEGNSELEIHWIHSPTGTSHSYHISNILRSTTPSNIRLELKEGKYDGAFHNIIRIPAIGEFNFIKYQKGGDNGQQIKLLFSESLDSRQNLNGLVYIEGYKGKLQLSIIGNEIIILPSEKLNGNQKIIVDQSILSSLSNKLSTQLEISVNFEPVKPALKLLGQGTIVPDGNHVILPFETIGLNAIDVEVFKIYESNVLQFLENNSLNENGYNLEMVGNIIYQEKLELNSLGSEINQDRWERVALDISKMTSLDKAALYQVRIGFRKAYTAYSDVKDESFVVKKDLYGELKSILQYPNYYDYDYNNTNNPSKVEYYTPDKFITGNLLSSDIGITAKMGKNKKLHVAVLDITQAKALTGVELNIYNQQKQLDQIAYTGSDGMTEINIESRPMFIIAKHGSDYTYLALQDYRANSLSDFDIEGKDKKNGIDGYIYGERGVWRPGDTIYLTFVVEDLNSKLPSNHPIKIDITDPRGTTRFSRVTAQQVMGMYTFSVPTTTSDPTGNWRATVEVGDQTFTKNLKVETVKPNRLKINYPSLVSTLDIYKKQTIVLEADWLYGANASGLNAKVDMQLSEINTTFDGYKSYKFDDPARNIEQRYTQVYDGKLDINGKGIFELDINNNIQSPGKLKVSLKTKVFEKSGNFSEDNISLEANPFSSYVGIKVPTTEWGNKKIDIEKNEPIQMVALDKDGNPLSNRKLKIGLYNASWRWWYNRRDNNLYSYNSSQHYGAIDTVTVRTDSKGLVDWKTDLTDYNTYLVRVCDEVSGHCSGELFYVGYSWQSQQGSENKGASLLFKMDKEVYDIDDEIQITLPSSSGSKVLVSVENNSDIIKEYWVDTKDVETKINIPVIKEMTPNVYVHLSMIQSYSNRKNDLPLRMYGVKSVTINNKMAQIHPEIKTDNSYEPQSKYKIEISESNNKPMAYTLAVVDEGLLDLTRYRTPSLYDHFYSKQSLGVRTWDIYDFVLNGYGAEIEKTISIGGDGEISNNATDVKANRFVPMVHFSGPYYIEKGKKKVHELIMPNYVGSVRVMVVAKNDQGYGSVDKSVPVKSDLMVLPTLPRVLAPGETLSLPVSIFSMNDNIRNVDVTIEASKNLQFTRNKQVVNFTQQGDQLSYFDFQVGNNIGVEKIKIIAKSGSYTATQEIEIDVRNPNPYTTEYKEEFLETGISKVIKFATKGTKGANEAYLELSTIPKINLDSRLRYLMRYPYGCVEQTTSSVFPQLYLSQFTSLDKRQQNQIDNNVQAGIDRLKSFQRQDGSFSYWPGVGGANEWATSYAGHFLLEASKKGHYIPNEILERWINYQTQASNNSSDNYMTQAYRLYTLAIAGSPNWSAMNRMKSMTNLNNTPAILLAATYALSGQQVAATKLRDQAIKNMSYEPSSKEYTYGSLQRNKALTTQALLKISNDSNAASLVKELANNLGSDNWYSTQTTAMALIAVSQYISDNDQSGLDYDLAISEGKSIRGTSEKSLVRIPIDVEQLESGELIIKNNASKTLFAKYIYYYKPQPGLPDQWIDLEENLKMSVRYTSMDGNIIDPKSISKGTDFIIETKVTNPGTRLQNIKDLALHQIFPSGWEIQNNRISSTANLVKNDKYEYQDVRDDRVYTFFDLNGSVTKTFRTVLTATYPGLFYLPDIKCEAMYDKEIRARSKGSLVEVLN